MILSGSRRFSVVLGCSRRFSVVVPVGSRRFSMNGGMCRMAHP